MDKKKGIGRVIWGAFLIVLGILCKVLNITLFSYEVDGVRQAAISDSGTLVCIIAMIVSGAVLVVTYFIPKKN